ncbi:hypothetical protein LCGC14_1748050 [marine sediment metagenome]|uniref:HD domain-containing protein n=1 Tax=marine sediment metagenome TaxID=412755 RepID=A0A0F9JJW6_9ZZZZ
MKIGTKSLLFGVHQFAIHPWFVAWAWWQLYSFPWDPRLWVAFFVHDLGYWGKSNMDGITGRSHPEFGAKIMSLFGPYWRDFCLYHSRFFAKQKNMPFSRLCVADKLAIALTPAWLYLPMAWLTGELKEYMQLAKEDSLATEYSSSSRKWFQNVQWACKQWAMKQYKELNDGD